MSGRIWWPTTGWQNLRIWTPRVLGALLVDIKATDLDMDLTGFAKGDLEQALLAVQPTSDVDSEPQMDRAEELRKEWKTAAGQIWELGEHRLMCGDSTKRDDVDRLMGGIKPSAIVTDPPYGVGVEYATFRDTEANTKRVVDGFLKIAQEMGVPMVLTPGVPVMWEYPQPAWVMVWVHPAPTGGCSWGFAGVNPILAYGKDPYLSNGMGRRPDHIVLAADREGVTGHPTPKPIKVWSWLVERVTTKTGDTVYDPFSGSGTTLIACEQLGRRCRAMEISPGYVAVTLQRFKDATGKTPRLINA